MITFWGPRLVILIRMAIIIRGVVCDGKGFIIIAIAGTSPNAHQQLTQTKLQFNQKAFQGLYMTILEHPKHVLHLVPYPNDIAKAFNVMYVMYWSQCPADIRFWPIVGKGKLI